VNQVIGVRCLTGECAWAQTSRYLSINPIAMAGCYQLFWEHMVESHGMNPNTSEAPGIDEAEFAIVTEKGLVRVRMTSRESEEYMRVAGPIV
jgi:hypothetical protein